MFDVFVSYSQEDQDYVVRLVGHLGRHGYRIWWDSELRSGAEWRQVITRRIDESTNFIVIWSKNSIESKWVTSEFLYAADKRKNIIPIRLEDVQLTPPFNSYQTLLVAPSDIAEKIDQIRKPIRSEAASKSTEQHALGIIENTIVSASTRYFSAQAEINSRLLIRANVNMFHMLIVFGAFGLYFGLRSLAPSSLSHLSIAFLMPLISTYFVAYYAHNDRIIGILTAYNRALERISENASPYEKLPRWFSADEEGWLAVALDARQFSDQAIRGLCIVSPVMVTMDAIFVGVMSGFNALLNSEQGARLTLLLMWCVAISAFNIWRLSKIDYFRREINRRYGYNQTERKFMIERQ